MKISRTILLLTALALPGCLNNKPKILGSGQKLNFDSFDSETASLFKFNFALQRDATSFYMQGASNSKTTMISTCNQSGSGCVCKFFKDDGTSSAGPDATGAANVIFDDRGNYFICVYGGTTPADVAKIQIQNQAGTVTSALVSVEAAAAISLTKLIGTDLDQNRVRSIYRYTCEYNFLQKNGTTTQTFDCSDGQGVSCVDGGDANNNFCFLKAKFPFFLYAENYSNNFNLKISDKLYGSNTDKICGLQIKQIDCVGTAADPHGSPVRSFGLYGEQTGIWDTAVSLGAGPDITPLNYGYAARPSATAPFACPPGLEKRTLFRADSNPLIPDSGINSTLITPGHNFTPGMRATEVSPPTTTPPAFTINKFSGGRCGIALNPPCSLPTVPEAADPVTRQIAYTNSGSDFCVIPENLLP